MISKVHPIISGDRIEKDKMGWACTMYWVKLGQIQGFGGET